MSTRFLLSCLLFLGSFAVAQTRMVPHLTRTDGGFDTQVFFTNGTDREAYVLLEAYTEAGESLATVRQTVPAKTTVSQEAQALFGGERAVSHFFIQGDPGIEVRVSYNTQTGTTSPVHVNESREMGRSWRLMHGTDWTTIFDGFAAVNAGSSSADITIRHLSRSGEELEDAVTIAAVPAKGKIRVVLADHFTEIDGSLFEVSSKNRLGLLVLRGTLGQDAFLAGGAGTVAEEGFDREIVRNVARMMREGREIFRYDTFGDEAFWGDTIRLHEGVAAVSPATALAVGLKVDLAALPQEVVAALAAGQVDLDDPAVTAVLLQLNAVVGVKGFFTDGEDPNRLTSIGITCALCHSTVDDAFAPGIGYRRDGWPNRDLQVGTIAALATDLSSVTRSLGLGEDQAAQDALREVIRAWGPGKFDAHVFLDRVFTGGPQSSTAVLIPAAFGMSGTNMATYNGWGSLTYWNAFVANLEMHGQGTFIDPRLNDEAQYPAAAADGLAEVRAKQDLITGKLGALNFYQMAIPAPKPPAGSFDAAAATRGEALFGGKANCASCHVPPLYTEPGYNLHTPQEIGIDGFQADRGPTKKYRTTPLPGLWARAKGGYYHDGRFADLAQVVGHYNEHFSLSLTAAEIDDLVAFLKSL
ncbi:Cytochrome c domain-containing protein [Sulfidibacter corallicola]|uniref:Cytochrome c domain-containing protein n=1 Tax=Sulfidibacter corallicola TaxID=2818388 RepID=A0A8A4TPQ4_SULCO|nr:hypothetical protein [Sulfidibacter corallicola]QTD50948.1 hypothetical protein J3U87_00635 [Sulfidibacter corallicola]